jgi:deuterolysin
LRCPAIPLLDNIDINLTFVRVRSLHELTAFCTRAPFKMHLSTVLSILSTTLPFGLARSLKIPNLYDSSVRALASSPLHVELRQSQMPGNVQVIVSNRGFSTAFFSTWRNPLSQDSQARRIDVLTAQEQPVEFLKAEGLVTSLDIPEEYEEIPAGSYVTRDINIVSNYEVQAGKEYLVQAGGFVPYRLEGDQTWTNGAAYETNILPITVPDYVHVPVPVAGNYILQSCEDEILMQKLNISIALVVDVAKKVAEKTAAGKNKDAFVAYFKEDNAENRKKVAERYTAIYKTLTDSKGPTKIACRAQCTGYYAKGAAWTGPTTGMTELCPAMKQYPAEMKRCNRMNWPGVLIHELSHSGVLYRPSTGDRAQGPQQCKALSAQQAIANADTFNLYAQSVYLDTVC